MKLSKLSITLLGGALLFSVSAFAGGGNKASLHLPEKVTVEGKALDPGNYTVEWEGTGPDVQVHILKGKETVATIPARLVEEAKANSTNAYGSSTGADGTRTLTTIYVGGKKISLEFEQTQASQSSSANNTK